MGVAAASNSHRLRSLRVRRAASASASPPPPGFDVASLEPSGSLGAFRLERYPPCDPEGEHGVLCEHDALGCSSSTSPHRQRANGPVTPSSLGSGSSP